MIVNFDRTATNPLAASVTGISLKGEVIYAGNGRTNVSNKWGPRFGVAYSLNSKTVIRAGFGIFFARQFALGAPYATVGYNQTTTYIASTDKTSLRPVMLSKLRGERSLVRTAAIRRSVLQADIEARCCTRRS